MTKIDHKNSVNKGKKLSCNGDSIANNTMTSGKVIPRIIVLLARDSKKCYTHLLFPLHESLFTPECLV